MKDQFEREIDYLRISVTDRCNLRCRYCMPEGVSTKLSHDEVLRSEEFLMIAECASRLGIRHIRITGGEPLVRCGCADLAAGLKKIPGIETVTITTNGILLSENLEALMQAGIDGVNVSLDTMDKDRYQEITGFPGMKKVLDGIFRCSAAGIPTKINAVTMPDTDPERLISLAKDLPVDVRFIEMMPIGYGRRYPDSDNRKLLRRLKDMYPDMEPESEDAEAFLAEVLAEDCGSSIFLKIRDSQGKITPPSHGSGPAVYFRIPGYKGSIGFISAVHGKFCASCNRVRLTSTGFLKTCLCYDQGADLKAVLRSGNPENPGRIGGAAADTMPLRAGGMAGSEVRRHLTETMRKAIYGKPQAHCFDRPEEITEKHGMSGIGG